jgi:hypothetical protein
MRVIRGLTVTTGIPMLHSECMTSLAYYHKDQRQKIRGVQIKRSFARLGLAQPIQVRVVSGSSPRIPRIENLAAEVQYSALVEPLHKPIIVAIKHERPTNHQRFHTTMG